MAGGLLNLVSEGGQSIILFGNPSKTFFKTTYAKTTPFGLQKFRIDYEGSRTLRLTEESVFTFKMKRYGDLLMDCYLSVDLPNIWSPIMPPSPDPFGVDPSGAGTGYKWIPYEFKWIDDIGAKMISKISITCGNQTLQEYSGDYLLAQVQRDFNGTKRDIFNRMSGNVPELNDPGNSGARVNSYPNAYYTDYVNGPDPSIYGRTLYVPLNSWFGLKSQKAFPLVSLQYNELMITVTLRPIFELFRIRDVFDTYYNYPYVSPNFNKWWMQMHRFLQPPPDLSLNQYSYVDTRGVWNADIHLNCTYGFLSNDESRLFATHEQKYLFKQIQQKIFYNVTGANKVQLESLGLISGFLFYFQRSDANLRNEWSNYTNWPYKYLPQDVTPASTDGSYNVWRVDVSNNIVTNVLVPIGAGVNPDGTLTGWMVTGNYNQQNMYNILLTMGIVLDGQYRENLQPVGVFNYIEKYTRTQGAAPSGLYCYNYSLDSGSLILDNQPSGAINMNRFHNIELEFTTIVPPLDPLAQVLNICDPATGQIIGVNKPSWRIFDYNFDMYYFEERINMVSFVGGNCGLMYAT